tara:strand:+ start:56 stop:610 length:555 start_codon:yes stop_codon:yes gene_type:complete
MKDKAEEKRHLYAFAYGFALLIPFFIVWHTLEVELTTWTFLGFLCLFGCVLFVVEKIASLKPMTNIWIAAVQLAAVIFKFSHGFTAVSAIFFVIAAIFFAFGLFNVEKLRPAYKVWMALAHVIGAVISTVFLTILYYGVFGISAMILLIAKKNLLDRKIDTNAQTYWVERKILEKSKDRFEKQY